MQLSRIAWISHYARVSPTIMSATKMFSNDSLGIVMWDHGQIKNILLLLLLLLRPVERFDPHDKICDILRAAIKSRFSADMLSLRMWYSVKIYITYRLLHTCNFFQMLMQINGTKWGHLQKGALCPMLFDVPFKIWLPGCMHRNECV